MDPAGLSRFWIKIISIDEHHPLETQQGVHQPQPSSAGFRDGQARVVLQVYSSFNFTGDLDANSIIGQDGIPYANNEYLFHKQQ